MKGSRKVSEGQWSVARVLKALRKHGAKRSAKHL